MSSVAWNLSRKLEWMGRRLRKIDDVGGIRDKISAMAAINALLKEVAVKTYKDEWRPWREKKNTQKKEKENHIEERCEKKAFKEWGTKETQKKDKEDFRRKGTLSWDSSVASKKSKVTEQIGRGNRLFSQRTVL